MFKTKTKKDNLRKLEPNKKYSRLSITFPNTVFILGIIFFIGVAFYAVYRIKHPIYEQLLESTELKNYYFKLILFSSIISVLFAYLLTIKDGFKTNIALFITSTTIALYSVEIILEYSNLNLNHKIQNDLIEDHPSSRNKIKIIEELRSQGVNAFPDIAPTFMVPLNGLKTSFGKIFPLGGISNISTVSDNELGYYPILEMDEHGFNNPKGLYIKNTLDIAIIGDSFGEGKAVKSDDNINAGLTKLGYNSINLAKAGSGTLIEYATLKEYVEPFKPKVVLFLYFKNDLRDLSRELKSSILRNYLENENYSQKLINRQNEIDEILIRFINREWRDNQIVSILKLTNIRNTLSIKPPSFIPKQTENKSAENNFKLFKIFSKLLEMSNKLIGNWNGQLYFVIVSPYEAYSNNSPNAAFLSEQKEVIHLVTKIGVPIIDIHKEIFSTHKDPLSLFPFRKNGHYTPEGYILVAKAIAQRLREDGITPLSKNNVPIQN